MTSTNKMRCKSVISHYGTDKQSLKACEELAELIRSISKLRFKLSDENVENLKEEIADVEIMIEQMKHLYNVSDEEIDRIVEQKLDRTFKRIEEELKNGI